MQVRVLCVVTILGIMHTFACLSIEEVQSETQEANLRTQVISQDLQEVPQEKIFPLLRPTTEELQVSETVDEVSGTRILLPSPRIDSEYFLEYLRQGQTEQILPVIFPLEADIILQLTEPELISLQTQVTNVDSQVESLYDNSVEAKTVDALPNNSVNTLEQTSSLYGNIVDAPPNNLVNTLVNTEDETLEILSNLELEESEFDLEEREININEDLRGDITLANRGWVFIESDNDLLFNYKSSKDTEETFRFKFLSTAPVTLTFQRQDLQNGNFEYKRIRVRPVLIDAKTEDVESSNNSALDATELQVGVASLDTGGTVPNDNLQEIFLLKTLEAQADEYIQAKNYQQALEILDRLYLQTYEGRDRILFKRATVLEAPNIRDIPQALENYFNLRDLYPFSEYREAAEERIRYIQRNILNVY